VPVTSRFADELLGFTFWWATNGTTARVSSKTDARQFGLISDPFPSLFAFTFTLFNTHDPYFHQLSTRASIPFALLSVHSFLATNIHFYRLFKTHANLSVDRNNKLQNQ
jgi:hypothetical protein